MASSEYFHLTIRGQGGHGGAPHTAVDPVLCAADVIQGVQAIQTREISVLKPTLITFCKVHGGTSPTIIPEEVVLEGSIRCLHEPSAETKAGFARIVEGVCRAHRTHHDLRIVLGNSLLVNDAGLVDLVRAGGAGRGTVFPHHHPRFDIDENALPIGVEMHVRTALRFLAVAGSAGGPVDNDAAYTTSCV
ncbi:MAG: peptidase dimerization domain-containing protein [Bacillota bacterium]|nr:peptidase dimerization domain-containing protein [Bacillota bacterium]